MHAPGPWRRPRRGPPRGDAALETRAPRARRRSGRRWERERPGAQASAWCEAWAWPGASAWCAEPEWRPREASERPEAQVRESAQPPRPGSPPEWPQGSPRESRGRVCSPPRAWAMAPPARAPAGRGRKGRRRQPRAGRGRRGLLAYSMWCAPGAGAAWASEAQRPARRCESSSSAEAEGPGAWLRNRRGRTVALAGGRWRAREAARAELASGPRGTGQSLPRPGAARASPAPAIPRRWHTRPREPARAWTRKASATVREEPRAVRTARSRTRRPPGAGTRKAAPSSLARPQPVDRIQEHVRMSARFRKPARSQPAWARLPRRSPPRAPRLRPGSPPPACRPRRPPPSPVRPSPVPPSRARPPEREPSPSSPTHWRTPSNRAPALLPLRLRRSRARTATDPPPSPLQLRPRPVRPGVRPLPHHPA